MRLIAENLGQAYGDHLLFAGLSFAVPSGAALIVTGPNGSGKSTLLRTVAGLMRPQSGRVSLEGGADADLAEQCHWVGFANALKSNLTARENLTHWHNILGGNADAPAIEAALARLGVEQFADLPAGILSSGLRRRLALARLLVAARPLWLLDEPTTALDAASTAVVAGLVRAHLEGGGIALIATHLDFGLDPVQRLDLVPAQAAA